MAEITDIEKERQRRLKENAMRMNEMGLANASAQLAKERAIAQQQLSCQRPCKQPKLNVSSPRTPHDVDVSHEIRRSSRVRMMPAPTYAPLDFVDEDEKRRRRARMSSSGPRGRRGEGSGSHFQGKVRATDGWQVWMGVASIDASRAARLAAKQLEQDLLDKGAVAVVKDMSESQVSGGFWCQLPKKFASAFNVTGSKYGLSLLMGDDEDDSTDVIFLPRPGNSAGLSGGWRTFAIEKRIFPNDSVVFEKVSEVIVKAHVFRAYDYDNDFEMGEARRMDPDMDGDDGGDDDDTTDLRVKGREEGAVIAPRTASATKAGTKRLLKERSQSGGGGGGGVKRRLVASSTSESVDEDDDGDDEHESDLEEEEDQEEDQEEEEEEEEKDVEVEAVEEEHGEVYEVEKIVGYFPPPSSSHSSTVKRHKGPSFDREMFKIRWRGYEAKDDTWEPRSCLDLPPYQYKWDVQLPLQYR